jgi:hypothetical protein
VLFSYKTEYSGDSINTKEAERKVFSDFEKKQITDLKISYEKTTIS